MVVESVKEDSGSRPGVGRTQAMYRRTIAPLYVRGSHAANDTLNHDYRFPTFGKSRLTVLVSSTGGSTHNVTVFGSHNTSGAPGEQGVTQLSAVATITGTTGGYVTSTGQFPHLVVRVQTDTLGGEQATGPTVNLFVGLHN